MQLQPEKVAKEYAKLSQAFRDKVKANPQYAKQFLLDAGILTKKRSSATGVTLAKRFRSAG